MKPGCYLMKDEKGKIIYVGKAKALRNRVRSYFNATAEQNPKTKQLREHIADIDFIVDDAPAKQGFYTPGSHIPIRSNHHLLAQPDKLIVFAWSFLDEIYGRCGHYKGDIIIPLPQISVSSLREAA